MTVRIERVEDWLGQTVVGADGEKIGRLEDVVYSAQGEPLHGTVSTGLFGRRTSVVPLAQATLSPDAVTVPYTKAQVKEAPQLDEATDMTPEIDDQAEIHYGLAERPRADDERYVTAAQRAQDAQRAAAVDAEASALESHADELAGQSAAAREQAQVAQQRAEDLAREQERAQGDAHAAREEHRRLLG